MDAIEMATIPETLAVAVSHHQAGELPQAERIYRQILRVDPNHADALHLLGMIASQVGNQEAAIDLIRRATAIEPRNAVYWNNLGNTLREQGKLDDAVASYRSALQLHPDFLAAHYNLGVSLQDQGKLDDAVASYRRALEIKPDLAEAYNNLGNALAKQGKLDDAIASYRRAVQIQPDYAEAHNNLGNALREQGMLGDAVASLQEAVRIRPDYAGAHNNLGVALEDQGKSDDAVACFQRALQINPDYAEAHNNLGSVLREQGKLGDAVVCLQQALRIRPGYAEAHNNLGGVLREQGKLDAAVACYQRALEIKPDYAEAHNNLGNAMKEQGKLGDAVASYRQAVNIKPPYAEAHYNLGNALKEQGKLDEAVASYRRALNIKPDYGRAAMELVHQLQRMCLWEDGEDLAQQVEQAVSRDIDHGTTNAISPLGFLALHVPTTAEQQLRCAQLEADRCAKRARVVGRGVECDRRRVEESRIRIGYLSADFRKHPVAHVTAELFEKHDRASFEILGYSCGPDDGSAMRQRLAKAFDRFTDVRDLPFLDAAQRIAADGVDILVDLTGYTQHARTEILAYRPAPLQVNYLGYAGTMGADFMDYILVDDFVVPPDQQAYFTERLVHLPGCYLPYASRQEISARAPSRAECGLPDEGFVLCCFNTSYKIAPAVFDVWMRLLKAVPDGVLWLRESNRWVAANLRREAERRGVSADRLVFAPSWPLPEHLSRYRLADLYLDTFPYNAHSMAGDVIRAGCPMLTLAGTTFPSRVAGSLLRALETPELIAGDLEQYEATALRLAGDRERLAEFRTRLCANRETSGVFDGTEFARKLERAYRRMWEIHESGERPRAFRVEAECV
jgi:predicted O-linked N-acetylglucosamine transferase (SPINDLY family)